MRDCPVRLPPGKLLCINHWAMVPAPLQREVTAAWDHGRGLGSARYRQAVQSAVEAASP